jgi:hypothetical protein
MISSVQRLHRCNGAVCGGELCAIVTASMSAGSFTERQSGQDIADDLAIG